MKRSFFLIVGWIIFLFVIGCGEKIEPGNKAIGPVSTIKAVTAKARIEDQMFLHEAVGSVEARLVSTVSSKVMGTVTEVKIIEGQLVKKDDILVVLTQQQISAGYQQAIAALDEAKRAESAAEATKKVAQANEKLAQSTFARYQKLVAGESASIQEVDEVKAKAESAKSSVAQAESMVSAAKQRVAQAQAGVDAAAATSRDTVLKAPYDAVVTEKMVEPGDFAGPGKPLIRLEGSGGYRVVFVLAEAGIGSVTMGQKISVSFPSLSDQSVEGTVDTIMPSADVATRSVEVKLSVPSIPKLRSGVFARVFVPGGQSRMIRIPTSAIVVRGQLTGVYKVDAESISRFRLVRTGRTFGGQVEILSGMTDGDRYVVAPSSQMVEGLRVEEGA
jgi:multidrug efflux pump subunit AcrA (membrane-fusion protein)